MDRPDVLDALTRQLAAALGDRLLALHLHGSLVTGDFSPGRSDLDLLAVLADDPDEALLELVARVLARVAREHPDWAGRIEVELVSPAAVDAGSRDRLSAEPHPIARVSPGEALHLLPATRHRVLGWQSVLDTGQALLGPGPREVLVPADPALVRAALVDHVRDWPRWVLDMQDAGGQAYAVLTTCRALVRLRDGAQLSKRAAADRVLAAGGLHGYAELVRWARDWWYDGGAADAPPRTDEVVRFVEHVAALCVDGEGLTPPT